MDEATSAKVAAYHKYLSEQDGPVTDINRAKSYAAGLEGNARRKAAWDASPVGAFQQRMANPTHEDSVTVDGPRQSDAMGFQRELVGGEGPQGDRIAITPTTSGSYVDTSGHQIGAPSQAPANKGPIVIPGRNAGRVTIDSNEAMTASERAAVADMAMAERGYKAPSTATFNGQSYVLPQSGPRVSSAKAQSFLQLAHQEQADNEARADKQRDFTAKQAALRAEQDRQARIDDNASADRNQTRKMEYDNNLRMNQQADYRMGRQQKLDARSDAMLRDPGEQRSLDAATQIANNPNADATSRAKATRFLALANNLPADLAESVGQVPVDEASKPIYEAINKVPQIASHLQTVKTLISEAKDLPWTRNLYNNLITFPGPRLAGMQPHGADEPQVSAVKDAFDQAVAMVMRAVPGSDEETVRAALATQVAGDTKDNTTVNHQLRPIWAPRAPAAAPAPAPSHSPTMGSQDLAYNPAF